VSCFYFLVMWSKGYSSNIISQKQKMAYCMETAEFILHVFINYPDRVMYLTFTRRWIRRILPYGRNLRTFRKNLLRPSSGYLFWPRPLFVSHWLFCSFVYSSVHVSVSWFYLAVTKRWYISAGLHGVTPKKVVFIGVSDYCKVPASSKLHLKQWRWWD
jgi:hypothetical protein